MTAIEPLPVVHAYRDMGTVWDVETRWTPRKVECTESSDHASSPRAVYVVKFRRRAPADMGPLAAAMCISEVISAAIMQQTGFRCLSPALVYGSREFAASCAGDAGFGYEIAEGYHFGTRFRCDVSPGPPPALDILAQPDEILRLWVLDCWLMNRDRDVDGNVLLELATKDKWSLVAADHSDCFMGAADFSSGRCFQLAGDFKSVKYLDFFEEVVLREGTGAMRETIDAVARCTGDLQGVMQRVPEQWWVEAGIDPDGAEECLRTRADRLAVICELEKWEGIRDAVSGGQQLDLLQ